MKEIWKNIVGWEKYYQVSNHGRVRRIGGGRGAIIGKILVAGKASNGYLTVALSQNNKNKTFLVHRLVLRTFAGKPLSGYEARHLDGNALNNRLDNLKWGTRSENIQDSIRHGTNYVGSKNGRSKLTEDDVGQIIILLQDGQMQKEIAIMFGISPQIISQIKLKQIWRHVSR